MQNDMVSIPSANMNGGLKAANNSGTVVGVNVAGTVMTNAQRVYLTPASSYQLASRQSAVGGTSNTGVGVGVGAMSNNSIGASAGGGGGAGGVGVGSNNIPTPAIITSPGSVRYFSQFSKLQPAQQVNASVAQRKLLNGDTMVLVNGSKPLIFATPNNNNNKFLTSMLATTTTLTAANTSTTAITVPNGNRVFINNQQQIQKQQLKQLSASSVIDEQLGQLQQQQQHHHQNQNDIEIKTEEDEDNVQQQLPPVQEKPLCMAKGGDPDAEPELDIVINNVVCSFSVRCHLKLRDIALNGSNVEYRRENGMVTMKLRRPYTTASIWSSGRITCTGATSELQAKIAARRYARVLNKLGFPTHFQNFRIVNVLGTCSMPWAIKIVNFSERHRDNASYEPELHPGVTYKMKEPKATLKIFSTGSITVTAASVNDVESAIQHIYPLVHEFRKQRSAEELQHFRQKHRAQAGEDLPYEDSILFNTTAAHTKITRPPGYGPPSLADAPITSRRRLEEGIQYQEMLELTQTNRCHIPIHGVNASNKSKTSSSDNICANARRRATECWATKLQNKRPRYNDPVSTATTTASTVARTSATITNSNPLARSFSGNGNGNGNVAINNNNINNNNNNRLNSKPLMPVDVVLKQSSSRARNAAASYSSSSVTNTLTTHNSGGGGGVCDMRQTFSPTDFQVDDLIEEDDDEDMSMQF